MFVELLITEENEFSILHLTALRSRGGHECGRGRYTRNGRYTDVGRRVCDVGRHRSGHLGGWLDVLNHLLLAVLILVRLGRSLNSAEHGAVTRQPEEGDHQGYYDAPRRILQSTMLPGVGNAT